MIVRLMCLLLSPASFALEVQTLDVPAPYTLQGSEALAWLLVTLLVCVVLAGFAYFYRMTQGLRLEQIKVQAVWRNVPDLLIEVDQEGVILAINQSFCDQLKRSEIIGTSCYGYLSDEGKALFRQHLSQALSTNHISQYELEAQLNGLTRYTHNRIIPLGQGSQAQALMVISDVTHFKDAQRVLQQDKQQFERTLQSKAQFLLNVSQDMRGPLTILKDTLEHIKTEETSAISQHVYSMQTSVEHLWQFVDDMSVLAKSKQGSEIVESINLSLWHVLDDLEALYLPQASQLLIDLRFQHDPLPHYIKADAFRLRQVLYNLMSGHLGICQQGQLEVMVRQTELAHKPVIQFTFVNHLNLKEAESWVAYFNQELEDADVACLEASSIESFNICQRLAGHLQGIIGAKPLSKGVVQQWFTLPLETVVDQDSFSIFKQVPIVLSVQDEHVKAWFHAFLQSMKLPFQVHQANDLPKHMSLLISDVCQPAHAQWLWWLGADYELNAAHAVILTPPYRREALYYRLSEYQTSQSETVEKSGPCKILLVEDNLNNQLVIKRTLEKLGYEVVVANNGEEGVAQFKILDLDCIIMDIQMPIMDGIEATKHIRQLDKPYVPIIALTANSQKEIEEACFAVGMDSFLTKPVSRQAIQGALEAFLGKQSPMQDSHWVV